MKKILIDLALLVGGAILFAIPHPSILFYEGLPFLSYFSVIPLFLLTRRLPWKTVWLWGLIYGALCYCLYVHWLVDFHPLGMPVIAGLFGIQYIFLFIVLKAVWVLCGKYGWIAQWIIWCAYEFLKTQGFAGFSYGVTAYSHWQLTTLIQCTNILGIWGLSAIITFPSAWLSIIIQPIFDIRKTSATKETYKILPHIYAHRISAIAWVAVYAVIIIYGLVSPIDYSDYETKTVALIQVNSDPWVGGSVAYRRDLTTLTKLTDAALAENNAVDFVVWSETAFVPSIRWHYKYREDRVRIDLVMELLNYIENTGIPFVIGNGDTMVDYNAAGMYERISYNSVFLFRPGENVIPPNPEIYNKMHLVPFTENFPFEKTFPKIYEALLNGDTHMWTPGKEAVVFTIDDVSFGTPICFEDIFGYIGRRFTQNGAQVIVNLSNDAWSHSLAAQYQHLSMAVFRSVENRIPSVRATASGQTCIIDPNGKVVAMAAPFEETYLVGDFPVMPKDNPTLYTMWGDYIGVLFVILSVIVFIAGVINTISAKRREA